jgi:hypothetical protein
MDSVFVELPAYYFRADSYIIASNPLVVAPPSDPSQVHIRIYDGPTLFVFDSAGTPYYTPGSIAQTGPTNLGARAALDSQVVLGWTNQITGASNYRLQRATGAGAFADLGGLIAKTDTATTDATAQTGNTYRYRLAAIWPDGGAYYYSNIMTVTVPANVTIARASSGLLFRDDFNRADGSPGANWVIENGAWTISGNKLVGTSQLNSQTFLRPAIAARSDYHVQVLIARTTVNDIAGPHLRRSGTGPNTYYWFDTSWGPGGPPENNHPRMYRQTAGAVARLGAGPFTFQTNTFNRLTFSLIGTSLTGWIDGVSQVSVTDNTSANQTAGTMALTAYAGAGGGTPISYDDVVVCTGRTVSIAGLPNGYRLRVGGIVSAAAAGGATVSVDLLGAQLPVAQIEILDSANTVVKVYAPADGVWGGDQYTYAVP